MRSLLLQNNSQACALVGDVGQQSDLTSALDSLGQLTLMHSAGTGGSAGQNLAALRHEAAELCSVLVVNGLALISAELANLAALMILIAISIESQGYFLLIKICPL